MKILMRGGKKKKKKGLESTTAFEMCPEPAADPFVTKLSILL